MFTKSNRSPKAASTFAVTSPILCWPLSPEPQKKGATSKFHFSSAPALRNQKVATRVEATAMSLRVVHIDRNSHGGCADPIGPWADSSAGAARRSLRHCFYWCPGEDSNLHGVTR